MIRIYDPHSSIWQQHKHVHFTSWCCLHSNVVFVISLRCIAISNHITGVKYFFSWTPQIFVSPARLFSCIFMRVLTILMVWIVNITQKNITLCLLETWRQYQLCFSRQHDVSLLSLKAIMYFPTKYVVQLNNQLALLVDSRQALLCTDLHFKKIDHYS